MPQHKREGRRLTVLHISQPVDGGVARVVTDLVRSQTRAGLRSLVACPSGGVLGEAAAEAGARVLPWHARREPGPHLPMETLRLSRLIRRTSPDLVHAHSAKAGLAARLAVRGRIPTVFQPHAWSFEAVGGTASELALYWERFAARWATRLLCVSEDERRRGHDAGVTGRWAVIRNGVDTEHFRPADRAARDRARSGIDALRCLPPDTLLVVCVGRLCRQKGQDVLLRAWPGVTGQVPGAVLALVGDGPAGEGLRQEAPQQVLFAGPTTDPAAWYAAADLVVLPSRWEGMALAPLEAMACGRPVVMSEVTGARESLPPRHAARGLVPPEDPGALARAMTDLLLNPRLRDTLGAQAQEHVRGAHDVRATADAVARLYRELLGPARAVPRTPDGAPPPPGRDPHERPGPSPETREHSRR
ncbi:glycosyltransferase [Streptomyces sp. NPDC047108]|uniref:glycosyltransferase n=1 Tax=Streptomyces sp. NPDC047108 TaxID=3155025 RepID=UPI0033C40351